MTGGSRNVLLLSYRTSSRRGDPCGRPPMPGASEKGTAVKAAPTRGVLFLLRLNSFGQLRQIHPPLGLMLELGFQVGELILQLLQFDLIFYI